jgi:hypothetical protein
MKKKMIKQCFIVLALIFTLSALSYADGYVRPYASVKGALSFVESDFDLGYYYYYNSGYYYDDYYYRNYYDESSDAVFAGSAALGVKTRYFRIEFEYTRRTEASQSYRWFPDIKQEFDTFLLNGFFDFEAAPNIIPFVGLGLGMTRSKNTVEYDDCKETFFRERFSVGIDFGVSFAVARHFNLDCGFKLVHLGSMIIEDEDLNMYSADIYLGFRYTI